MARVGLERALSLHDIPLQAPAARARTASLRAPQRARAGVGPREHKRRTVHGSEGVPEVSIGVVCVTVGVLPVSCLRPSRQHVYLVYPQSFPHLWKKLWKIGRIQRSIGLPGRIVEAFDRAKAERPWQDWVVGGLQCWRADILGLG